MSNPKLRATMHVSCTRSKQNKSSDILVVKERIRDTVTGEEKPNIRIIRDYKRPFWLTKKGIREEHNQKRDYEYEYNLDKYECTQAELPAKVHRALYGFSAQNPRMSNICQSPYIYGTDATSSVIFKRAEDERAEKENGTWKPDMTVAVMDYETDVVNGTEKIIAGAVTYKDKVLIACTEGFLGTTPDAENQINEAAQKYLDKYMKARNVTMKVRVCKNNMDVVKSLFTMVHALKPDLLAFWNMKFDIGKILETCEEHYVDPANIFCDPAIPEEYRNFRYREDQLIKVTASGKSTPKHPADLWHVISAPASFFCIDGMCTFKMLRAIEGMRHSYSLDATLGSELDISKLKFDQADHLSGLAWHRFLQKLYKIEYLVYCLFDCMSVEMLDEKTKDMSRKVGLYADGSELGSLKSNPKRLANDIHFYLLKQGKVLCSTSNDMTEEDDKHLLSKVDWIVTLANELATETGCSLYDPEYGIKGTRVAKQVADIDITSGYPTAQRVFNISKSTTLAEICKIDGLTEKEHRRIAVDMTACAANSVDIGQTVMGLPKLNALTEAFLAQQAA